MLLLIGYIVWLNEILSLEVMYTKLQDSKKMYNWFFLENK